MLDPKLGARLAWNGKLLSRPVSKIAGRFRINHLNVFLPEIDSDTQLNLAACDSTRFQADSGCKLFRRLFFRETDIPCIVLIWSMCIDQRVHTVVTAYYIFWASWFLFRWKSNTTVTDDDRSADNLSNSLRVFETKV